MPNAPISQEAAAILENRRLQVTAILEQVPAGHPEITLELGSGHGHYLTAYARAFPGRFCLGVDRQGNRITRSLRKQDQAALPNLRFVRAEIGQFLACLPDNLRLSRILVLFPDPWPKRRHEKNRLLGPAMLEGLASRSSPGADLFLRSDSLDYLEWVEGHLRASPEWRLDPGREWPFEVETVFQRKAVAFHSLAAVRENRARSGEIPAKGRAALP